MFKSWKIARIAGIDLRIHATFLLLLGWIGISSLGEGQPLLIALNLFFPILLFAIVVLHELGHALAARHFGIGTRDITLYPIGGVARLERMPSKASQEIAVAAAGPAVNLVLAGGAYLLSGLALNSGAVILGYVLAQAVTINLGLALFNLLPAFPMDGGRILRAYLSTRFNYSVATNKAAAIGRKLAWVMGLVGLVTLSLNLIAISVFVWLAATAEQGQVAFNSLLGRGPAVAPAAPTYNRVFTYAHAPRGGHDPRVIDGEYRVVH